VIPQAFGRFSPGNLILHDQVCGDCNGYFGRHLELFLARDSLEGLQRLRHKMYPKDSLKKPRRVQIKIAEGKWKGVIVAASPSGQYGQIGLERPIQAGFFNQTTQEYDYFLPEDVPKQEELEKRGYDTKGKMVWLLAEEKSELEPLMELLKSKGIDLSPKDRLLKEKDSGTDVLVFTEITIDSTIFRALAKIAFNYLVFVAGREFVLSRDFNEIRDFIRNGRRDRREFFVVNSAPILYEDQKYGIQTTQGHLMTVGWQGADLICKISLFNFKTYIVRLCHNFSGIWRPIRSGHHFDIETKTVSELFAAIKILF
jgi:hypothetical protein